MARLRRALIYVCAAVLVATAAKAAIDGANTQFQQQEVAIGQLRPGMGTATGNTPTINNGSGIITTASLTTAAGATQAITLTNSRVAAGDGVVAVVDGNGSTGTPVLTNARVTSNQVVFTIQNIHASVALNAPVKIYFLVLKQGNAN